MYSTTSSTPVLARHDSEKGRRAMFAVRTVTPAKTRLRRWS
ncbi:Uncharacterised protein [Bordetella pertussis]|nr:Uncharacterised protein [Bordetella pertussis]